MGQTNSAAPARIACKPRKAAVNVARDPGSLDTLVGVTTI
jgi:hypothetical protein